MKSVHQWKTIRHLETRRTNQRTWSGRYAGPCATSSTRKNRVSSRPSPYLRDIFPSCAFFPLSRLNFAFFWRRGGLLVQLWSRVAAMDHQIVRLGFSGVILCELQRPAGRWHHSWSGVQRSPGVQFVQTQHQCCSCDCPNSRRLSSASVTARDQIGIVAQKVPGSLDCDRTPAAAERRQKLTTGCSWQRVEAFFPLVLRLWLNIIQDVVKQLGTMFDVALLPLRFSSRVHNFDTPLFTPIGEFIADLCTMRIDFEPAWSHLRSQPSISSLCRV